MDSTHEEGITASEMRARISTLRDTFTGDPTSKLALVYMMAMASSSLEVDITASEMAQWLEKAPRTANRAMERLMDLGLIEKVGRQRDARGTMTAMRYHITIGVKP